MTTKDFLKFILTVLLAGATIALAAFEPVNDDTDIFLANPSIDAERPNVLLILDNTANWNAPFANEKSALVSVVNGLTDQQNLGMMIMSDSNIKRTGPTSSDGAYVRYHIRQMTPANKNALATVLGNFDISGDKGDNNMVGMAMYEAYLYYAGKASRAGDDQLKADFDGRTEFSSLTSHALPGAGPSPGASPFPTENALYRSPIINGCARNFVIFLSNGPANENATARSELEGYLGTLTGVTPPNVISITPDGQKSNWADEMAKFMANADVFATSAGVPNSSGVQNVYTYTIEINPTLNANLISVTTATPHGVTASGGAVTIAGTTNYNGSYTINSIVSATQFRILSTITPSPAAENTGTVTGTITANISSINQAASDMTALLKSMAANGKGKYFGVSSDASGAALVDALNQIFAEVQAVNSVFASTTLPVSVNVRGTNLNQVYIGVFRPDSTKSPRWLGNLKMYNLAFNSVTRTVFLADASNGPPPAVGNAAENTNTGFVSNNATSFWTSNSSYWGFRSAELNGPGGASDRPDGDLVEKGGAAQQLRLNFAGAEAASPLRRLYTCTTGGLVSGTLQNCLPNIGFSLALTPFSTTNDAINGAALQLDTRLISPLSAFQTKPVTALTDRRAVALNNTNPANSVNVTSLSNGVTTRTMTSLTTAVSKSVTSLNGTGTENQVMVLSSVTKSGSTCNITSTTALPSGVVDGATVAFSGISGGSSLNGTSKTIDAGSISPGSNSFSVGCTGSAAGTGGSATINNVVVNTSVITATMPQPHGFISGQTVTIQGAGLPLDGPYGITCTPAPACAGATTFTYNISPQKAGIVSSLGITASANTTTATATFATAHGFAHNSVVNISGASLPEYNGAKTISCTGNDCTGMTTFTYSVGAIPIGPNTVLPVYAVQGGGTVVTATTATPHGFFDGDVVVIAGSDIPGYNGTWRVNCLGGCIPLPPFPGGLPAAPTQFRFNTATDNVAPTTAIATVLPVNTSTTVTVALAGATIATVTATVTGAPHGLAAGSSIVIESVGATNAIHPGTYTILTVPTPTQFTYSTGAAVASPTGTFTARPPTLSSRAWATVPAHGYGAAGTTKQVFISGAVPSGYNSTDLVNLSTATILDADTISYSIPGALGPNSSGAVSASIKGPLARATAVNHGFPDGSTVTVAGASPAAFNGAKTITVIDANTFTYPIAPDQGAATGTVTASQGTGASPERDLIIRWVRGEDNFQDENLNASTSDIRASVHGDVLHSRPAVVNYNRFSNSDDDVFVYYGGNDGIFHAVKGGYTVPTGDASNLTPGMEAWGFIPSEFFGQFKRMRNNSPIISSSFKKPYFMDGPIGIYTKSVTLNAAGQSQLGGVGDIVNLYISNRRGGRFLYALDVNTPTDPKFLWKLDPSTAGYGELGQTWSLPTVIPVESGPLGLGGLNVPVLVFGAGYDPTVEDIDPTGIFSVESNGDVCLAASCSGTTRLTRSMGRGIYVVNALTGALIWRALGVDDGVTVAGMTTKIVPGMNFAIPSDVTLVRNESGGPTNRGYVGDTGGNLWRIDFSGANLSTTTVTKLGTISDQTNPAHRRKFLFPPDVVGQFGFDAVLIGTGDREHPFDSTVTNRFYMFKDQGNDFGPVTGTTTCNPAITEAAFDTTLCAPPATTAIAGMSDLTSNCLQDAAGCLAGETQSAVSTKLGTDRGWYITLGAGEKVVGNAVSIAGTTFFNTNQPDNAAAGGTCGSNLGIARQYQVASADATATSDLNAVGGLTGADRSLIHAGGGYLPSPVHVVVTLDGHPQEAVISGVQVSTPPGAALSARLRKYWYKEVDPR